MSAKDFFFFAKLKKFSRFNVFHPKKSKACLLGKLRGRQREREEDRIKFLFFFCPFFGGTNANQYWENLDLLQCQFDLIDAGHRQGLHKERAKYKDFNRSFKLSFSRF